MEYLLLATIVLSFIGQVIVFRYFISQLKQALLSGKVEIPSSFKESPNEITRVDDGTIEFSEENPLDLPKDIKFEVEGDGVAPPGFKTS